MQQRTNQQQNRRHYSSNQSRSKPISYFIHGAALLAVFLFSVAGKGMMEPKIGAEVIDRNGTSLGTVDYIVRDTWNGEIRKLIVYRKPPQKDLNFTPQETSEITENTIRLNITINELD